MAKNKFIYIIIFLINSIVLYSNEKDNPIIEIYSSINTMETYIGQHIEYKIAIKSGSDTKYRFNNVEFTYPSDEFNVLSIETNIANNDGYTKTTYNYKIAFYNHGIYNMPNFYIEYIKNNNHTVLSNTATYIRIKALSDGEYLPPIKNNQNIAFPWHMLILAILIIIIIISAIIYILYLIQKRNNDKNIIITEPEDTEALKNLGVLENKIMLKEINIRQYYFALTQIFRKYLTIRFNLPILEMTTDDMKRHISHNILPDYKIIIDFLGYSDFIKFSKLEVSNIENAISSLKFCEKYIKKYRSKKDEEKLKDSVDKVDKKIKYKNKQRK